jgi:hypothetical protein
MTQGASADLGTIGLIKWQSRSQGTLRGFAAIRIEPFGLVINDVSIHRNGSRVFARLPGKPQINTEGRVLLDDRGKREYVPICELPDDDTRGRFSDAVVAALQRQHAGDLA